MGCEFASARPAIHYAFLTYHTAQNGSRHYYHHAAAIAYPALILMGNEQAGLTDTLAAACDVNVKIPMRGRADSLNLAVATGIMVYAVTDKASLHGR